MHPPKPPASKALLSLQERIGYTFEKPALLQQAMTHRSFSSEHYERLEYLGDAVINVIVSDLLYQALPDLPEGQLSRIRSNLVKQDSLHSLALQLGLSHCLRLGEGEAKSGGAKRPSILRHFSGERSVFFVRDVALAG